MYNFFGTLPSCFSHTIFCPQRVRWIPVSKRRRVGIAMMFSFTLDYFQRWSQLFQIFESLGNFRLCGFVASSAVADIHSSPKKIAMLRVHNIRLLGASRQDSNWPWRRSEHKWAWSSEPRGVVFAQPTANRCSHSTSPLLVLSCC